MSKLIFWNSHLERNSWLRKGLKNNATTYYFRKITKSGFASNKEFRNTAEIIINDNIARKIKDESVTENENSTYLFNSAYINALEKYIRYISSYPR